MCPISIVNGPIHNDIRLPECFIACYRRLDSRVRREGKEREKKKKKKRGKEGETRERQWELLSKGHSAHFVPSLSSLPHPLVFFVFCFLFFSAHFSMSCPHDLNACNRLNASVFCFLCFLKPYFLISIVINPLKLNRKVTKSISLITARTQGSDWVQVCLNMPLRFNHHLFEIEFMTAPLAFPLTFEGWGN